MAAQRRRARGLDTCRRASPPPSRTTSVRSWTYAASAAFEARTCSTCSAVARKRRRIGSARRDAIPGMPSRARTSGWRTVAHGALLRRPAPLKSRSTSLLASPSHTKNWMQRGRHSGTRTAPLRPTIRPRTLRRWVNEARRGAALVPREGGGLGEALHWLRSARALSPSEAQIALDVGIMHDYAEHRAEAMDAYETAYRLLRARHPDPKMDDEQHTRASAAVGIPDCTRRATGTWAHGGGVDP
ncbi:hypothetical protein Ctob_016461 [Chrysochromulina tobinii]|uniref:Uncharacterized protein n=1 Tax=Chrysochromulina tobinii TaxID=1460289 RepID=A0A0M0JWX4_9EUKA|nr:hypothetical protein Ctob_016461 [Chrysochromulina tobinii]|eukprot:KOO30827.1 hypothetical protein Ctob_016461 [Chrysochromulina sp. CCMP291]